MFCGSRLVGLHPGQVVLVAGPGFTVLEAGFPFLMWWCGNPTFWGPCVRLALLGHFDPCGLFLGRVFLVVVYRKLHGFR